MAGGEFDTKPGLGSAVSLKSAEMFPGIVLREKKGKRAGKRKIASQKMSHKLINNISLMVGRKVYNYGCRLGAVCCGEREREKE